MGKIEGTLYVKALNSERDFMNVQGNMYKILWKHREGSCDRFCLGC